MVTQGASGNYVGLPTDQLGRKLATYIVPYIYMEEKRKTLPKHLKQDARFC